MNIDPISVANVHAPPAARDEAGDMPASSGRQPVQIGPYRIERVIGRGGMGTVYKALVVVSCEVPIGSHVALKLLRETEPQERRRFAREAGYLQALRHPNIVRVLDAGEYEGQPYLVMQLIEGHHADDLVIEGRAVDQQRVADLAIQALDALQVAHHAGILHRDIKPGNIMITPAGQVKLVDFGLAQYIDAESHLTATGAVVGTPAYMSPEQASGRRDEISRRCDIYSMGACLYELLTGEQPFTADNSVALLRRIIEEPLVPPSRLRRDLHRDLETIVLKAMSKDPRDRYASAAEMAADLRRFQVGVRVRTKRPGPLRPLLRTLWNQRATLAAMGLVLFVAAAAAVLAVNRGLRRAEIHDPGTTPSILTAGQPVEVEPPPPADPWLVEWAQVPALDAKGSRVQLKPLPTFGKDVMSTVGMPAVSGPVRLSATINILAAECQVNLLICDSDIGNGYRLRLVGAKANDRLELMRENKVVAFRDLGQLVRGNRPQRLRIERVDDTVTVALGTREPIVFPDLIPIESMEADGVYIAYDPSQVKVSDVLLQRQRGGLTISALTQADSFRQTRRYYRAKELYENFLRDHPDSKQVRDADLRIALCLEGLKDDEQALAKFVAVASANRDDPRYVLTATFHAWGCALRLKLFKDAEEYFEAIRRKYDIPTLLATVNEKVVRELVKDYLERAATLSDSEPDRAIRLYATGADFATYLLQQPDIANDPRIVETIAKAHVGAGDLLRTNGRAGEALDHYQIAAAQKDLPTPLRLTTLMRLAEVHRLLDNLDAAEVAYQMVVATTPDVDDAQLWARLWLGDLVALRGNRPRAFETWAKAGTSDHLPARIMRQLVVGYEPLPLEAPHDHDVDILYFNARLAWLRGREADYAERLQGVMDLGTPNVWPRPLAKQLLAGLTVPVPAPDPVPPSDDPAGASTAPIGAPSPLGSSQVP